MEVPDLTSLSGFLLLTGLFFIVIIGRYLLIAGIFYGVFYKWFPAKWQARKINKRPYKQDQLRKEVTWSTITALIFSVAGSLTLFIWQSGWTKVYLDISEYGWWYLPVSLLLSMFLHETYYYWVHRWMHHPKIFRVVHKVHHDSNITSPFTAFSFHPIEGLLQAVVLPVTIMLIPLHPGVILLQLTIMTFSSVINHLDIEVYPKGFENHFIGKWIIGATHHSLHHKQFRYNYGLYFTFWDKIKKTESPFFKTLFKEKTRTDPGINR
jgi:Delta7-sterol 5-desaturase